MSFPILAGLWPALPMTFAVTLALAVLIVLTRRWHGGFTFDQVYGVQKLHSVPTPRIGGLPILLGLACAWNTLPDEVRGLLAPLALAVVPAALSGFLEDVTRRIGVTMRLIATLLSGAMFWLLAGGGITRVDLPPVDVLLGFAPLSFALTVLAVAGLSNAVNIIDGLNGLAGLAVLSALAGLGLIAQAVGDAPLAMACALIAAAVLGFWVVNWPLGRLFLGDGGAYFLGFAIACLAILLSERNPAVSPFAMLLLFVHPISEVTFSVFRRHLRGRNSGHADALHLHSLVKRRWLRQVFPARKSMRNSVAGLILGGANLVPAVLSLMLHRSSLLCAFATLAFALGYVAIYARLVRFRWRSPTVFLLGRGPDPQRPGH